MDRVSARCGMDKKDVDVAVQAAFAEIMEVLADGKKLTFLGFGSFEPRERKGRMGRNPKTGEVCCHMFACFHHPPHTLAAQPIEIKASVSPAFSPAKAFKDLVKSRM